MPLGAAPVASRSFPPGREAGPDPRIRCFLVGGMIGEETVMLTDALVGYGAAADDPTDLGPAARRSFIETVAGHRDRLAKLVPEAVRSCGVPPEGRLVAAWDRADTALRDLLNTPREDAAGRAWETSLAVVHVVQNAAGELGVDPPLLRNLRRIDRDLGPPPPKT